MSALSARFNEKMGITKWACQSCNGLIANGYSVEGKLISVIRETRFHEKTYVCAPCLPTAIQAMTLAVDKQIHALMDPWVALPDYDPAEDQPEHVMCRFWLGGVCPRKSKSDVTLPDRTLKKVLIALYATQLEPKQ